MTRSRARRLVGAAVLSLGLVATSLSATSAASAADPVAATSATSAPRVAVGMSLAMQRDLGLTAEGVQARLAQEERARAAETVARTLYGSSYAGSWFDPATGKLAVAVAGTAATAPTGLDVTVVPVAHTHAQLDAAKTAIDRQAGRSAPAGVNSWYVDVKTNTVVVSVNRHRVDDAVTKFVEAARTAHPAVRVVEEEHSPVTRADVVGGWPYWINYGGRCSVGFAVYGGFVTAGHCGTPGSSASDQAGALLGHFAGSTFPYYDYAWVRASAGVNLYGYMEGYDGYWYYVRGSSQVPVGSGVCRSGSTTGMWCNYILGRGQTVNYPQGVVYGLTRTNVCAEPGDSGGSWLSANQAQGVTSGGSGNCSSGGTTYYQEVNPILSAYGLSLILT
ncbi:S1 family peptidase [Saccharothrix longispora]|uniref:Streptogrisin C n=1 Tax=Saccharothrix longispora TaxID=33920 RepID=A0ABU1Q238_9PSEU|nr:S1 family peptidase [Saccharothrix longispora]MDR6596962.1 streptogrisin C [Saccharothrix longispora]